MIILLTFIQSRLKKYKKRLNMFKINQTTGANSQEIFEAFDFKEPAVKYSLPRSSSRKEGNRIILKNFY